MRIDIRERERERERERKREREGKRGTEIKAEERKERNGYRL